MLGKTANGLYWMFRYLERSENTARLMAAGQRIALTRSHADDEWASVLETTATLGPYRARHGEVTRDNAIHWMLCDRDNASSVLAVVESARNNARLVRTALTREVWESVNESWMILRNLLSQRVGERELPAVLTVIRNRSAHVRGAFAGTMLRNDIYNFARLGTFIERADNTARLLDVKSYVLLPSAHAVGSSLDNVQWETILRSVSAEGAYRMTYGQDVRARNIAQFLILDRRMPRSLAFSVGKLVDNFGFLADAYGTLPPSGKKAAALQTGFASASVDGLLDSGLHEFVQGFLRDIADLGAQAEVDYRFYD
ncbi:alpha-E domain-containing protein [Rubellimicrobium aerolatum]|uniref:Alpha-E domain-containing protein n=1 Tax=Rubellimicrobium aerolatum TaxID=490979 RepID=A0ABW0SBY7_9RHOB|nr:alpha-E domain-containing protein [Rubellimicrobium aerolatum]MBP1806012.1 putative alpha-E superfamily protein [Rubellimicrobium aerolatum]